MELAYASTVHGVQGATADRAHLVLGEQTGPSAAYVGMTRGRQSNVVHVVAADVDVAREQWVAAFGRDRADLGPAHAAALAAAEAANYAEPRPLDQVLDELRAAWTLEQDALDRLARLEPLSVTMGEVAAIRHEQDRTVPALANAERDARQTHAEARARLMASEAVVARDADRLQHALARDWDAQRPAAAAAAATIEAGNGRFGGRRAAVAQAHTTLQDWATTWRPYLPGLPTDPDALTRLASRRDNPTALADQFGYRAHQRSEQLHREHTQARTAAEQAQLAAAEAQTTYRDTTARYSQLLWRHGRAGHTPNPAARAEQLQHAVSDTRERRPGPDRPAHRRARIARPSRRPGRQRTLPLATQPQH